MAENTRLTQLSDTVRQLQEVTKVLTDEQSKQEKLIKSITTTEQ